MKKHRAISMVVTGLIFAALACNAPGGGDDTGAATATFGALLTQVAETAVAAAGQSEAAANAESQEEPTEAPVVENTLPPDVTATNTAEPQPTEAGVPHVTANVDANVRKGSSTSHEPVGVLLNGQTANIDARNAAGTWYRILFPATASGQGWIAASVVTVSGDTSAIPIVADPHTPTFTPTSTYTPTATYTATATETSTATATATTASPTDLVVSSAVTTDGVYNIIYTTPKPVNPTTTWNFNVRVKNIGSAGALGSLINGYVQGSLLIACLAPPADAKNTVPLAPAEESVDIPISVDTVGYGTFVIEFKCDYCGVIDESNNGNNTLTVTVTVSKTVTSWHTRRVPRTSLPTSDFRTCIPFSHPGLQLTGPGGG